jgi:hypothetical protein
LKDVARDTARDLSALVGELAALKADAHHWLTDPEYAALKHRLKGVMNFDPEAVASWHGEQKTIPKRRF